MKSLPLLPGWPEVLSQSRVDSRPSEDHRLPPLKIDLPRAAGEILHVETVEAAQLLLETLKTISLSAVAIDSEYTFSRPEIELRSGKTRVDIRSQSPQVVSIAALAREAGEPGDYILRAVLDVRQPETLPALKEILRLRVPFVFHHLKSELFTFWALGLDPDLHNTYDTYLAAACLHLGRDHRRSLGTTGTEDPGEISGQNDLARKKAHRLSLVGQCEHYGLSYPFSGDKEDLRKLFMSLKPGAALTQRMIEYASADAEWTLRLYAAQQPEVFGEGLHHHLHTIEFPFAVANARMEWRGVHVSPERRDKLREATRKAAEHYAAELLSFGIVPAGSRDKFLDVMKRGGLLDHFRRAGKLSTEHKLLEEIEELHPAIRPFRLHSLYQRMASEEWVSGVLVGADGRTHPKHNQLGADTGRNSCGTPNIAGIGRILRPVVTAPPGRALVELDYSQIEVGVAAAEHDDPDLIGAFNSGDVYSWTAQRFYAERLTPGERSLGAVEFKQRRPELRNAMKTFVLAVIYNIQAPGIATKFGIPLDQAERERARFLDLFPVLKRRLEESSAFGKVRGYASVVTGLRRRVDRTKGSNSWKQNLLRNTPIQGSAAVIFKIAVIRMDQAFRGTDVWLVLPVHDAILIECPAEQIDQVSEKAARIMMDAVRTYYPKLEPRVDVNKSAPGCWNKDGHADSLDRFLADPTFRLDGYVETTRGASRSMSENAEAQTISQATKSPTPTSDSCGETPA